MVPTILDIAGATKAKKKAPFLRTRTVTLLRSTDLTVQLCLSKPGRRAILLTPQILGQLGIKANVRARAYNLVPSPSSRVEANIGGL